MKKRAEAIPVVLPEEDRYVKVAAYGLILSGFVYLFQTGIEIAAQGKLVVEITFLHLFAGVGLLQRSRIWRFFTLFSTGFFLLTHIIVIPLILVFLLKAGSYPQLLWIGGAEHPSAVHFFTTFVYETLISLFFIYVFILLLNKRMKTYFLPVTQASPLPCFNQRFAFGAAAGLLAVLAGYGIQRTGVLQSSPDKLETDVLYASSGQQIRPGPDGIIRIPRKPNAYYYGLIAADTQEHGLPVWTELQIKIPSSPEGKIYCKTIRYIPSLLTIEKRMTGIPGSKVYLERRTGLLQTGELSRDRIFREIYFE